MLNLIGNLQALNLIGQGKENYDLESYQEQLYLAGFSSESGIFQLKVFIYDRFQEIWREIYQQEINQNESDYPCQVNFCKLNNLYHQDNLFLIVYFSNKYSYFRLEDDNFFVEIKSNNLLANLFNKFNNLYINDKTGIYLLEKKHLKNKHDTQLKYYSDWSQEQVKILDLSQQITEQDGNISHINFYQNHLYLGCENLPLGINLYKLSVDENQVTSIPVIVKGAYRYSLNQTIFATTVFQNCLYLACGLDLTKKKLSQFHHYKNAFELIRIYEDDDWDIITGSPKFSPQGLKVPLSTLDYGFDENNNIVVDNLIVHQNKLFLLTKNIDNLQIWFSKNGEDWEQTIIDLPLNNYAQVNMIKTLSLAFGLVLLIEFHKLNKTQETVIFSYCQNS